MLTTIPFSEQFDLQPWVGQRSATFRFQLINGVTGEHRGDITPIRGASLSHDTSRTIKRQLNLTLGADDTALIEPVSDRILLSMELSDGTSWPLGRYMFTDDTAQVFTSGDLSNVVLNDEMFLVDQNVVNGINAFDMSAVSAYEAILTDLPVTLVAEPSTFLMTQSWGVSTRRGQMLDAVAVAGDYFSPWFGNDTKMHLIRTFNPATRVPQFDFDAGNQVMREGITRTSNLLTAPNRFLVISNTAADNAAVTGMATVPPTAPNSFSNRGFYITEVKTLQLSDVGQAAAVAEGLANRLTVFETVTLNTPPDPRHDSYDVIAWQGDLWLELAWTMALIEGGTMSHTMRKGYMP